jgi:hypothetical protein
MSALAAAEISTDVDDASASNDDIALMKIATSHFAMICESLKDRGLGDTQLKFMSIDNTDTDNAFSVSRELGKPGRILIGMGLLRKLHGLGKALSGDAPSGLSSSIDDITMGFISVVIAHEMGHQVQDVVMIGAEYPVPPEATTKCYELEADVLAGTWLGFSLGWQKDRLQAWYTALWRLGDIDFMNPNTHGMPPERVWAASSGVDYFVATAKDGLPIDYREVRKRLCRSVGYRVTGMHLEHPDVVNGVHTKLVAAAQAIQEDTTGIVAAYEVLRPAITPLPEVEAPSISINLLDPTTPGTPAWQARGDAAEAAYLLARSTEEVGLTRGIDVHSVTAAMLPVEDRTRVIQLLEAAAENLIDKAASLDATVFSSAGSWRGSLTRTLEVREDWTIIISRAKSGPLAAGDELILQYDGAAPFKTAYVTVEEADSSTARGVARFSVESKYGPNPERAIPNERPAIELHKVGDVVFIQLYQRPDYSMPINAELATIR